MKSYLAIDVLANRTVGRYETYAEAAKASAHLKSVDIQYRPRNKKVKKQ